MAGFRWCIAVLPAVAVATICPAADAAAANAHASAPVIAAAPVADQLPGETPAIDGSVELAVIDVVLLLVAAVCVIVFIRWRLWRLPHEPLRPQAFSPGIGFALYIAQYLAAVIGAQLALALLVTRNGDAAETDASAFTFEQQVTLHAGSYALQLVVVSVFLAMLWRAAAAAPAGRPCLWRASLAGAAALLLTWPVAQAVGGMAAIMQTLFTAEPAQVLAHETLRQMLERQMDGWFLLEAALVIGIAPVVEEVLYRGVFQETLRRLGLGAWPAILFTSVFFAAMHWVVAEPHAVVSLAVLSVGFGWVYERTGRLMAPIVMHGLFNAGNLAMAVLLQPTAAAALLP